MHAQAGVHLLWGRRVLFDYKNKAGVRQVIFASEAIKSIQSFARKIINAIVVFAIALTVAAAVLIVTTVQMAAASRRREIEVMKLVGATNWFIRIPFMLEGLVQGLVGALLAIPAVILIINFIESKLTDTETINLNIDVENTLDRWKHKAGASWLRTVNDDVTSADRWELRGESQYSLTERSYLLGSLRYEDDRFTDFDYQATAAGGYGYRFIMTETTKLEGQIGPGFRQAKRRATGEKEENMIGRGAMNFEHKLTGTTLIYDRLLVESGSDNTFVQNALGMEVKINDSFALGLD